MIAVCFQEVCPSSERVRGAGPRGPLGRRLAHLQAGPARPGHHGVRGGARCCGGSPRDRGSTGSGRRSSRPSGSFWTAIILSIVYFVSVAVVGDRHEAARQGPARPEAAAGADLLAHPRAQPARPAGRLPAPVLMPTYVLGLSCFYHDSAAALLRDGEVVAACQEERLSPQEARLGLPRRARSSTCCKRGRHRARGPRRRRLLRQAAAQVRADALHVRRDLPALVQLVPQGDAALDPREALGARRSSARSCGPTRGRSSSPSTT